jgi:hypothetical protein
VVVRRLDASLVLEMTDDGIGLSLHEGSGVGLSSMRERAVELSGDCVIGQADPHGTAIVVRLPFRIASDSSPTTRHPGGEAVEGRTSMETSSTEWKEGHHDADDQPSTGGSRHPLVAKPSRTV